METTADPAETSTAPDEAVQIGVLAVGLFAIVVLLWSTTLAMAAGWAACLGLALLLVAASRLRPTPAAKPIRGVIVAAAGVNLAAAAYLFLI